uniref:Alpha/beta hydrolase fold-3 domain-containing protein n=1 Tax=Kalanchoe fedtschenkoi TaxID=63787 RepID=A0A7N0ZSJ7_KALFE
MAGSGDTPSHTALPTLPWLAKLQVRLIPLFLDTVLRPNGTVNRGLLRLLERNTPPNPDKPVHGVVTSDVTIDPRGSLSFRVFAPEERTTTERPTLPVIVYFHGGGFVLQTAQSPTCDSIARKLALQVPAVVASLSYRLAPEHKYPAQHQDAYDMLTYLDANPHALPGNADLSRTFLAGESAGGNLAHFAASKVAAASSVFQALRIKGLVAIQPFFGGEERTESEKRLFNGPVVPVRAADLMWRAYLPEGANRDHEACNVSGGDQLQQVEGFPRSFVVVGGLDPLQDWQRRYCEWLRRSGKEVEVLELENGVHGFYTFPELDETRLLYEELSKFVNK